MKLIYTYTCLGDDYISAWWEYRDSVFGCDKRALNVLMGFNADSKEFNTRFWTKNTNPKK